MTAAELIEKLLKFSGDLTVFVVNDEYGARVDVKELALRPDGAIELTYDNVDRGSPSERENCTVEIVEDWTYPINPPKNFFIP